MGTFDRDSAPQFTTTDVFLGLSHPELTINDLESLTLRRVIPEGADTCQWSKSSQNLSHPPAFVDAEVKHVLRNVSDNPTALGEVTLLTSEGELRHETIYYTVDPSTSLHIVPQYRNGSSASSVLASLLLDARQDIDPTIVTQDHIRNLKTLNAVLTEHGISCAYYHNTYNNLDSDEEGLESQLLQLSRLTTGADSSIEEHSVVLCLSGSTAMNIPPIFIIVDKIDLEEKVVHVRDPHFSWSIMVELDALIRHLEPRSLECVVVDKAA